MNQNVAKFSPAEHFGRGGHLLTARGALTREARPGVGLQLVARRGAIQMRRMVTHRMLDLTGPGVPCLALGSILHRSYGFHNVYRNARLLDRRSLSYGLLALRRAELRPILTSPLHLLRYLTAVSSTGAALDTQVAMHDLLKFI